MESYIDIWNKIAVHIWLITSSYGIMFAILSFFDDIGSIEKIKNVGPFMKGIVSFILGLIFYILVGIPHFNSNKK